MMFRVFFFVLMVSLCCDCCRKVVFDNTRNFSYTDSLVSIVEYDPDGEFNNSIGDSGMIEPAEPKEPIIKFNTILKIPDLKYDKKIFVRFEIKFKTVVRDTIIVDSIAHMCLYTYYNDEIPESILMKDSLLQRKVYEWLFNNTYTTKDDIQGKRIFGKGVIVKGI